MSGHEYICDLFRLNPNLYSGKLYYELRDNYKQEVVFTQRVPTEQEWDTDQFIPAELVHGERNWIIKIFDFSNRNLNLDRVLSHELLHILLRYRKGLPWIDQNPPITRNQAIIFNAIDHRLINPDLDKVFGEREERRRNPKIVEVEKKIAAYLEKIDGNIDKNLYIEIFQKCIETLSERMPRLLYLS